MVRFGYTIIYVKDVVSSLVFFETAFGLQRRFLHKEGDYGELETGETTLAFASHELATANFKDQVQLLSSDAPAFGIEIALVADDLEDTHNRALSCGATEIAAPTQKPWGQTVSYLRCPAGSLIELCTPIAMK